MLKSQSALDVQGAAHDRRLISLLEGVSRQVDGWCSRHFFTLSATRLFDSNDSATLRTPDLISVYPSGMRTDEGGKRSFDTVWDASDFLLHPANADPTGGHDASRPYTAALAGGQRGFPVGPRTVRISGEWGYWRRLRRAEETTAARIGTSESSARLNTGADVETGHTILVGSEQMYVRGREEQTIEVARAVNGSAAAAHSAGSAIWVYEYPAPVVEAVIIQCCKLWRRGGPAGGAETSPSGLDADARQLVSQYRRLAAGVV